MRSCEGHWTVVTALQCQGQQLFHAYVPHRKKWLVLLFSLQPAYLSMLMQHQVKHAPHVVMVEPWDIAWKTGDVGASWIIAQAPEHGSMQTCKWAWVVAESVRDQGQAKLRVVLTRFVDVD